MKSFVRFIQVMWPKKKYIREKAMQYQAYKLQVPKTVKNIRILPFILPLTPTSQEKLAC